MAAYLVEAGEGEHAPLVDDMIPAARGSCLLQGLVQLRPHALDALCHLLQLTLQLPSSSSDKVYQAGQKRLQEL